MRTDVDQFLATRIGDPAWEIALADSVAAAKGIYTECLLEAFRRPFENMVARVDGRSVIPNRRLRRYLEQEVPRPAPMLSDVASTAIGLDIAGATPSAGAKVELLARSSGFAAASSSIFTARAVPAGVALRSGFSISGQKLESVTTRPGVTAKTDCRCRPLTRHRRCVPCATDPRRLRVPLFLTVGSPLAIRAIRRQFLPLRYPPVSAWYNAFDPKDVVALYPLDVNNFPVQPAVENNNRVHNSTDNHHGIIGYLDDVDVARHVIGGLGV